MNIIIKLEVLIITPGHRDYDNFRKKLYKRKFKNFENAKEFIEKKQFKILEKLIKTKN
jgi:hypothetical protein